MSEAGPLPEQDEEAFSDILKRANVGLLLLASENQHNRVLYANAFMEGLTGFAPGELQERGFFELVTGGDASAIQEYYNKVKIATREPPHDFDIAIQRKNGDKIDLNVTTSLMETAEEEPYVLLIVQNITNRKAFERVIVSSFDKFIQTTIELDAALKKIREQSKALANYKEKIQNELMIASSVQRAMIPQTFPANDFVDIWGESLPCSELGGDYLDIFQLDRNRLGILLADVSGHGVHAALISAMAKVYFVNYSRHYADPAHVLARVNSDLEKIFRGTGFYLSAVYSVLDLDTMIMRTATAGHENPLCYFQDENGSGGAPDRLLVDDSESAAPSRFADKAGELLRIGNLEGGAILGSLSPGEVHYNSLTNQLRAGSTIVYYTDGIPEARNAENQFFGDDRLHEFIRKNHYLSAREFTQKLFQETETFYQGAEPNDDRTLVVLQILKSPQVAVPAMGKEQIREYFNSGQGLLDRGQFEEAIVQFQKIIEIDQDSFRAHHFIGRALSGLQRFEEAEEYFQKTIVLNPEYLQGFYQLGIVVYNQGEFEQALRIWKILYKKTGEYKKLAQFIEMAENRTRR
ncbi:MAG: SpoIIE family protein phosphatase [bacterium]|nr:SpoIIE family protein phosphatase [bacterium]